MQALNLIDEAAAALALRMAEEAGAILRRHYRVPVEVSRKADASPVTLADREVEASIRALIEAHFPKHGIIGEEFGNVREKAQYQWVIDPIDGTRSFIGGYPLFTTLIALAADRVPVLGLITQPISGESWLGIAGKATTLNGAPARTRSCAKLSQAVIATTSIDYFTPDQHNAFFAVKRHCANTVLGGDAYAYAMLASGQIDIVMDAGLKQFDYSALRPVIEGAGGVITDWEGRKVTLDCDGRILAAANAGLHQQALTALLAVI